MAVQSSTSGGGSTGVFTSPLSAPSLMDQVKIASMFGGNVGNQASFTFRPGVSSPEQYNLLNPATSGGGGGAGFPGFKFNFGGGGGGGQQGAPYDVRTGLLETLNASNKGYDALLERLSQMRQSEAQNIQSGASRAATFLSEMDPLAGYRETYQNMSAPTAAATSYLNAIGADPAQVQAQQALSNQLMASQAQGQSAFGQAMDASQANYRAAQQADVYANAQRANDLLGIATGSQATAIEMRKLEQQDALRRLLLEYQLEIAKAAMSKKGGGGMSLGFGRYDPWVQDAMVRY